MVPQPPAITPHTPGRRRAIPTLPTLPPVAPPTAKAKGTAPPTAKAAREAVLLTFPGVPFTTPARSVAPDPVLALLDTTAAQQERAGDYLAAVALRSAAARIASLTWRLDRLQRKPQTGGRA